MLDQFKVLSQADVEKIHDQALAILENIGIYVGTEEAREQFAKAGFAVDGEIVKFDRAGVEKYLNMLPSEFTLHGRNPEDARVINTKTLANLTSQCPPFAQNLDEGRHLATNQDHINLTKIAQKCKNIDVFSKISCETNDLDPRIRHIETTYNVIKYATKPYLDVTYYEQSMEELVQLAAIARGGIDNIREKPVMAFICSSLTPLGWEKQSLESIKVAAKYGQPVLVSSLPMAGATSPITLAGTLTGQHAEIIAGLVLTQIYNPGNPCVYSTGTCITDMRSMMMSNGSPETALFNMANCQLGHFLGLPVRTSAGLTDSKCVDMQAGYETMMNLLSARLAGVNFQEHAAGILESYNTVSYEKMVIDDEICGYINRIDEGICMDEDHLAYDEIEEEGPRGNFVASEHTVEFMGEIYRPQIAHRDSYTAWETAGKVDAEHKANQIWHKMLDEYDVPSIDPEIEKDMLAFMNKVYDNAGLERNVVVK